MLRFAARATRKVAVAVLGAAVLLAGIAMLVLPGPAFVVIPAGLAILGLEFAWARQGLARVRAWVERAVAAARDPRAPQS